MYLLSKFPSSSFATKRVDFFCSFTVSLASKLIATSNGSQPLCRNRRLTIISIKNKTNVKNAVVHSPTHSGLKCKKGLYFGLNLLVRSISGWATPRDRMSACALGLEGFWREEIKVMAAEWWNSSSGVLRLRAAHSWARDRRTSVLDRVHPTATAQNPPTALGAGSKQYQTAASSLQSIIKHLKQSQNWPDKLIHETLIFFTEISSINFILLSTPYFYLCQPFSNDPVLKVSGSWLIIFSEKTQIKHLVELIQISYPKRNRGSLHLLLERFNHDHTMDSSPLASGDSRACL